MSEWKSEENGSDSGSGWITYTPRQHGSLSVVFVHSINLIASLQNANVCSIYKLSCGLHRRLFLPSHSSRHYSIDRLFSCVALLLLLYFLRTDAHCSCWNKHKKTLRVMSFLFAGSELHFLPLSLPFFSPISRSLAFLITKFNWLKLTPAICNFITLK